MKKVFAHFDDDGVFVYQAFRRATVTHAVLKGTFGKGFGLNRITWIKPSFAWMLQRSKYATKSRMDGIAKIKLSHEAWLYILGNSIQTQFDCQLFESETTWQDAQRKTDITHQWDPERDLIGRKLKRSAIQIGLRGEAIRQYVAKWIISVEDVTELATTIGLAGKSRSTVFPSVPVESEYPLEDNIRKKLGYQL